MVLIIFFLILVSQLALKKVDKYSKEPEWGQLGPN